jgi:predicted dehydrogenase
VKQIRLAVVGVGRWGSHFVRLFAQHPQVELVAIADHHPERLQAIKARLQLPETVQFCADWSSVAQLTLDAVALITPATTHFELVQAALTQGLHVLTEKPLTLEPAECLALADLATQQQRILFVDHTYLFNDAVIAGRGAIATLGDLRYGYARRTNLGPIRSDVDALWDLAIHDVAIFNHWLAAQPIQVQVSGSTWLQPDLSDVVWAHLTYPGDLIVTGHWSWGNPHKQRCLALVGSQGTVVFDEMQREQPLQRYRGHVTTAEEGGLVPQVSPVEALSFPPGEPLQKVCDQFIASVQTGELPPVASGYQAAELVNILAAMARSLQKQGQPQPVPPL